MIGRIVAGGVMIMTMGCTSVPSEPQPPRTSNLDPWDGEGQCREAAAQDLLGRPASAELGRLALERTGARTLRWIRPGDAVTMDLLSDRLNIELDAQGRVRRVSCG
jgi:hypothetical protein